MSLRKQKEIQIKNEISMQQGDQWEKKHKNAQFKLNKKQLKKKQ